MTDKQFRQLVDLAKARDEKRYGWMRHLLLLATGSLTVLASFRADIPGGMFGRLSLGGAWIGLGLGILLGAFSLHGEVWMIDELVKRSVQELKAMSDTDADRILPISVGLPERYKLARKCFCITLALAVVCLVGFGLSRLL